MSRLVIAALLACGLIVGAARADMPAVRIAVLKYGTVSWLVDTILAHDLDAAARYRLEVVELAGRAATSIALQAGGVDVIVADWLWALQRRGEGGDLRFAPYARALGALMTAGQVAGLCDLRGRPIGVVGGERDKSWLVLQALVRAECGFDLAEETTTLVGAAPLMSQQLFDGAVDAVVTYWHHAATLEAAGMSRLIGIEEAIERLGIAPAPALIGFVWDADRVDHERIARFLRSVEAAREILERSDAAWERLRPQMRAASGAEFRLLRDGFRQGRAGDWREEDIAAAAALHRLLIETGGRAVAAGMGRFDPALFRSAGDGG